MSLKTQAYISKRVTGSELPKNEMQKQVITTQIPDMKVSVVLLYQFIKLVPWEKFNHLGKDILTSVHNLAALRPQNYLLISNQKIKEHLQQIIY